MFLNKLIFSNGPDFNKMSLLTVNYWVKKKICCMMAKCDIRNTEKTFFM